MTTQQHEDDYLSLARSLQETTVRRNDLLRELQQLRGELKAVAARLDQIHNANALIRSQVHESTPTTRQLSFAEEKLGIRGKGIAIESMKKERGLITRQISEVKADRDQYLIEIAELKGHIAKHRETMVTKTADESVVGAMEVDEAKQVLAELARERDEYKARTKDSARRALQAQEKVTHWLSIAESFTKQLEERGMVFPITMK